MEVRIRIATIVTGLSLVALPLLAQRVRDRDRDRGRYDDGMDSCRDHDWSNDDRARYCEMRSAGFKASGAVRVEPGDNGGIRVSGWDRDSVDVTVKVQASAGTDDAARALAQRVTISASDGTIRADGPATRRRESWSVSFDVRVPRRTDVTASTVNGPIAVGDVAGRMELETENGPVSLGGVGGDVRARTTNGPLVVTLNGEKWDGQGLDAETENGPVTLTIPERYAAHLETGTVNGPMNVDFPLTLQGRINFRRIETDINGGGPSVRAVTTNGPVTVRRD